MSKTKSVVLTTLLTIVIVLLCLMCVVPEFTLPFRVNGIWTQYNSVVSVINYGSDLGGGYSAVYYPEGVISAETYNSQVEYYEDNLKNELREYLGATESDTRTLDQLRAAYKATAADGKDANKALYDFDEYVGKYVAYTSENFPAISKDGVKEAAVYMELNEVCYETETSGKYAVEEDFKADFETAVKILADRFDKKNLSSLSVCVKNGCAIEVKVPSTVEDVDTLFEQMGYTGEFMIRANEKITTKPLLKPFGEYTIADYFKGATFSSVGKAGSVNLELTALGRKTFYDITNALKDDETDASVYFYVGEHEVIGLGLNGKAIDQDTLYISGTFTSESAENVAIVIDSCIKQDVVNLHLAASATVEYTVGTGAASKTAIYVVFAVVMLAMFVFFIVRYKGLGVAHVYAYLSYLICMIMFIAFLSGMILTAGGVFAVLLTSIMMSLFNLYIFENVRKEFETGKTLSSAFKAGYKRSLAPVLDTHILLFIIALVLFFSSIGEVVAFSYVFLFGVLMSGISTLLLTRYYAYIMRGLLARSKQHTFCGFKREVSEDDED